MIPISSVGAVTPTTATGYLGGTASSVSPAQGADFASQLTGAVDGLQSMSATSNELAIKAVTGDLADIHQATIASTRAQVTLELVAAVRNKGIDAFTEIMRMQA